MITRKQCDAHRLLVAVLGRALNGAETTKVAYDRSGREVCRSSIVDFSIGRTEFLVSILLGPLIRRGVDVAPMLERLKLSAKSSIRRAPDK